MQICQRQFKAYFISGTNCTGWVWSSVTNQTVQILWYLPKITMLTVLAELSDLTSMHTWSVQYFKYTWLSQPYVDTSIGQYGGRQLAPYPRIGLFQEAFIKYKNAWVQYTRVCRHACPTFTNQYLDTKSTVGQFILKIYLYHILYNWCKRQLTTE